jgi:hypothetical protein
MNSTPRKTFFSVKALLWIAPLVLFGWILVSGRALFWGTPALQFIPWRELAWRELMAGELPLWNMLNGMGAPLLANYQLALWYPPGWLTFLFEWIGGTTWMAWSMTIQLILHIVWAGYGMTRLLRFLKIGELGQVTAGLAFSLSGYLISRAGFSSIIWTAAWMPWVVYGFLDFVKKTNGEKKKIFQPSFYIPTAFMLLAGHAQTAAYTLFIGGLWGLVESCRTKKFSFVLSYASLVLINGLLAAGLAAVQLIPTAEYLINSQRATAVGFDQAMNYSFWPWHLLNLISPEFFGNPGLGDYWGFGAYWEDAVYCGLIPMILAIFSFRFFWKKGLDEKIGQCLRPVVLFLWSVIFVTVLLALGNNLPIFPWLYRNIPGFDMFQAPARMMIWVVFSIAVLAGISIDGWSRPNRPGLARLKRSTAIFFAVILGTVCVRVMLPEIDISFIRAGISIGIIGSAACIIALQQPLEEGTVRNARWRWMITGLIGLDLIIADLMLNPTVPISFYSVEQDTTVQDGRVWISAENEYSLKFDRFLNFDSFIETEDWDNMIEVFLPNSNIYTGRSLVNNFDPMIPENYAVWMDWMNSLPENQIEPLLDLMNVSTQLNVDEDSFQVTFIDRGTSSHYWTASCAQELVSQQAAIQALQSGLENGAIPFLVTGNVSEGNTGECDIRPISSSNLEVNQAMNSYLSASVNMDSSGWLMISDTMFPGWTATIDGVVVPIYSAYGIFRTVWVEDGQHEIEFHYQPISFFIGLGISIGLIGLLLVTLLNKNLNDRLRKIAMETSKQE